MRVPRTPPWPWSRSRALAQDDAPLKRNPYVASPDQIRITREGDYAVFEYADDTVATTQVSFGKAKLASMSDEQLLAWWNESIEARDEHRESVDYVATEVPPGKPQVEFFERGDQWTPRGHVLRCEILHDTGMEVGLDEPFVSLDGRDFTLREFTTMIGTFGGWGMRIEFVPKDALHERPELKVSEPKPRRELPDFAKKRS